MRPRGGTFAARTLENSEDAFPFVTYQPEQQNVGDRYAWLNYTRIPLLGRIVSASLWGANGALRQDRHS